MKKFLALFLAMIMSIGLCTSCGSGNTMSGTVTPKDIIDSKKVVLGYLTEMMSKDEVPRGVVVFQAGTALMFDDTEFTMGELSKMSDEEIVSALYKEELNNAIESYQSDIKSFERDIKSSNDYIENCNNSITNYQNEIAGFQMELEEEQKRVDTYNWYDYYVGRKGDFPQTFDDFNKEKQENKWFDLRERDWIEAIWSKVGIEEYAEIPTLTEAWNKYKSDNPNVTQIKLTTMNYISSNNFSVDDERIDEVLTKFDTVRMPDQIERVKSNFEKTKLDYEEKINQVQEQITELEDNIADYNESITESEKNIEDTNKKIKELEALEKLEDRTTYKTVINIISDESGNEVTTEYIMLLEKDDIYLGLPLNAKAMGAREDCVTVYDSSYCGYVLDMGNSNQMGYLFFRSESSNLKLEFDNLDTKGVLIDVEDKDTILDGVKE